jgi:hypothetical protein
LELGEIARRLNKSRQRVHQMVQANELPAIRFCNRWYVPAPAWEMWLAYQSERAMARVGDQYVGTAGRPPADS